MKEEPPDYEVGMPTIRQQLDNCRHNGPKYAHGLVHKMPSGWLQISPLRHLDTHKDTAHLGEITYVDKANIALKQG